MAFSDAVIHAETDGFLAPPAAQDLLHRLTDLQTTIATGHSSDAGHKIADLIHHLGDLENSGQLPAAGQSVLAGPLAALETAIPPQAGPAGPPPPQRHPKPGPKPPKPGQ